MASHQHLGCFGPEVSAFRARKQSVCDLRTSGWVGTEGQYDMMVMDLPLVLHVVGSST